MTHSNKYILGSVWRVSHEITAFTGDGITVVIPRDSDIEIMHPVGRKARFVDASALTAIGGLRRIPSKPKCNLRIPIEAMNGNTIMVKGSSETMYYIRWSDQSYHHANTIDDATQYSNEKGAMCAICDIQTSKNKVGAVIQGYRPHLKEFVSEKILSDIWWNNAAILNKNNIPLHMIAKNMSHLAEQYHFPYIVPSQVALKTKVIQASLIELGIPFIGVYGGRFVLREEDITFFNIIYPDIKAILME